MRLRWRGSLLACSLIVLMVGHLWFVGVPYAWPAIHLLRMIQSEPHSVPGSGSLLSDDVKLSCVQPKYDSGVTWCAPTDVIRHDFEVVNEGSTAIWVSVIHSYSGIGPRPQFKLEPGVTTRIPLFLLGGRAKGRFTRLATVRVDTPPQQVPCRSCGLAWSSHPHGYAPWAPPCSAKPLSLASFAELMVNARYPWLSPASAMSVLGIPLPITLIASLSLLVSRIRNRPVAAHACQRCGYDLRGHLDDKVPIPVSTNPHAFCPPRRCPECATPF